MHPYIKHLLEDIQNAERSENDNLGYPIPTSFEEEMEEIERYVGGEGGKPVSTFTGLNKENFPPAHQLTDGEMEIVLMAFDKMLATWNIQINWINDIPTRARYEFLLKFILNQKITPVYSGTMHLDFCTGYAPDCDWGTYCSCLEYWKDEISEK